MTTRRALSAGILVALLSPLALADFGAQPAVDAGHVFVGDPLYAMHGAHGALFDVNADEVTQMASTTKSFTLHLAIDALDEGVVHASDVVTIGPNAVNGSIWVPYGSSLSNGSNPNIISFRQGEQVVFADLLRAMMYPSGNDAAVAVAEHVAQAYDGPDADVVTFVGRMNDHAAQMGLSDTHFTNPAGLDGNPGSLPGGDHRTTAREEATWFAHAIANAGFQAIVGYCGNYSFTTGQGFFMKTYTYGWCNPLPGWEGDKGGSTALCNGIADKRHYCDVMSVRRLGRRLVGAQMQSDGKNVTPAIFNHAFEELFHPDPRGGSVGWGKALDQSSVCTADGRVVNAIITPAHDLRLVTWSTDIDIGTIDKLAQSPGQIHFAPTRAQPQDSNAAQRNVDPSPPGANPQAGSAADAHVAETVDVDTLAMAGGRIVVADKAGGTAHLTLWRIAANGTPEQLVGDVPAGDAVTVRLARALGDTFALVVAQHNGSLQMQTWRVEATRVGGWALRHLADGYGSSYEAHVSEATAFGPGLLPATAADGLARVFTAARTWDGKLVVSVWHVTPEDGAVVRVGSSVQNIAASRLDFVSAPTDARAEEIFAPTYFALAMRDGGELRIRWYEMSTAGTLSAAGDTGRTGEHASAIALSPLGQSGIASVARQDDGTLRVDAWWSDRLGNDSILPVQVSHHVLPAGHLPDVCELATPHAEGDLVVSAVLESDQLLRLQALRVGDRPQIQIGHGL